MSLSGSGSPDCKNCGLDEEMIEGALQEARAERDKFWTDQEMGKSSDCYKHCEEAKAELRKKLLEKVEGMVQACPHGDYGDFRACCCDAVNKALSDLKKELE